MNPNIKNSIQIARQLITEPTLGSRESLENTIKKTLKKYSSKDIEAKRIKDAKIIYDEIYSFWKKNESVEKLNKKVFKKIPMVLPLSFENSDPLLDVHNFLKKYLDTLSTQNDSRSARKLFKSVLRNFDKFKDGDLKQIFKTIRPLIIKSNNPLCKKLASIHKKYDIISPDIVQIITDQILRPSPQESDSDIINSAFLNLKISPSLQEGGLGASVGKKLLRLNLKNMKKKKKKKKLSTLDRTLEYFVKDKDDKKLRLNYLHDEILEYLLSCFIEKDPPDEIKQKLASFIDDYFGDPRGNSRWNTVKDEIRRIPIRWKVGVTLDLFFKLLADMADKDETHKRHWKRRKDFWETLLKQGEIHEAWIVLGRGYSSNIINQYLTEEVNYATFSSSSGDRNHCAILLKIRGYTIAEWSHNGATRIYEAGDQRAPRFYEQTYRPDKLKTLKQHEDGWIRHGPLWKDKVEEELGLSEPVRRRRE